MFLGLRTVIYPAPDLAAARAWWSRALGSEPYFDEPFYVGFEVAGYELGLDPNAAVADGPRTYWGVADCAAAVAELQRRGATVRQPLAEVGEGIRVALLADAAGNPFGVIENPHFRLPDAPLGDGPGR
jgi:predicted enzyme related to lactoylglutathione lyase